MSHTRYLHGDGDCQVLRAQRGHVPMSRMIGTAALILVAIYRGVCFGDIVRVPSDFPTIQQGFDALSPGDTVLVANGEYAEGLIAPALQFWLLGDVAVDTGDFSRPVIDVSLTPDSLNLSGPFFPFGSRPTVERFRFRNRHDMIPRQCIGGVTTACDSVTFRNCAFDSCFEAVTQAWQDSIVHFATFDHCTFRYYWSKINLYGTSVHATGCSFTLLANNALLPGDGSVIEDCQFVDIPGNCVLAYVSTPVEITIRNCLFGPFSIQNIIGLLDLRNVHGSIEHNVFAHIRSYWNFVSLEADSDFGATFADNTFYDCKYGGTGTGGQLLNVYSAARVSPSPAPYLVERNVMSACTLGDWAIGIHACDRAVLSHNRLYDLAPSPVMGAPAVHADSVIELLFRENLFYHNHYAMGGEPGIAADARWNWWGDSTGPYAPGHPSGQGDTIGLYVDYDPWYADTSFLQEARDIRSPLPKEFVFEVYPNPFNSILHLTLIPSEIGIVRVELFDILGRKASEIWKGPLAFRKDVTFDASALASGIYFARVTDVISRKNLAMAKLVLLR